MKSLQNYKQPKFDGLNTAPEILCVIAEYYTDGDILDITSDAYKIWAEPSSQDMVQIVKILRELADDGKIEHQVTNWGDSKITF